jgi:transcriptional regulator with XRE-family HTH domain
VVNFPEKKEFGERVAKLRLNKGVSAREMSLAIGQNEAYINSIETGKNYPSMEGLSYICEYLDITPREFFDFETESPKKLSKLTDKMKHLKSDQLALIESMVDNMK